MRLTISEILGDRPDLISIFYKKAEYADENRDSHGRSSYRSEYERYTLFPVVSKALIEKMGHISYPGGREFAVVLTHDVDNVFLSLPKACFVGLLKGMKGDVRGGVKSIIDRLIDEKNSVHRCFNDMMELENNYGAKSTFFFMNTNPDHEKGGYMAEEISEDIQNVAKAGWEVGLHGSYYAADSPIQMLQEKNELEKIVNKPISGYRNHYLRFSIEESWRYMVRCGFKYDSTFGYANQYGFRNGLAHPFKPFDMRANQQINIWELPLCFMDQTLRGYMGLNQKQCERVVKDTIDRVKACNGIIVLNWHNDTFSLPQYKQWANLYEYILNETINQNGWLCNGSQMINWWEGNGPFY